MANTKIKAIAFHLPQYHPIPENDAWWGKGFTEWTNTVKAKPLFSGHYQPHVPADLGFYDLRLSEARAAQADMAKEAGLSGFCYYHYWFGGKELLERPVDEILRLGEPDFDFCLCWANQTWTGIWHGAPNRVLIEQTYPGDEDHRRHFERLLPAFRDRRYIKVDGKPLFVIYRPMELPDPKHVADLWQQMAVAAGFPGLHLVGVASADWTPQEHGFDASIVSGLPKIRRGWVSWRRPLEKILGKLREVFGRPDVHFYEEMLPKLLPPAPEGVETYPLAIPNWDNTPRSGARGMLLHGSTPELFRKHLQAAVARAEKLPSSRQLLFIKSWNEWAEGNHLEPDLRFGRAYLDVVQKTLS
jgi:hypothetical protein